MKINCAQCGKEADKRAGDVERLRARGYKLYCSLRCSGLASRKYWTKAQRTEGKRLYDIAYRKKNAERIAKQKKAWQIANYDPEKQRIYNKKNSQRHVEYCRRPEYKAYKHQYDMDRRAKQFGPFAEAYKLELSLRREIRERINKHESNQEKGTINKRQARQQGTRTRSRQGRRGSRRGDPPSFGK